MGSVGGSSDMVIYRRRFSGAPQRWDSAHNAAGQKNDQLRILASQFEPTLELVMDMTSWVTTLVKSLTTNSAADCSA